MTQFNISPQTGVGSVTLGVHDLEMMKEYYQEVIGLDLLESWQNGAVLGVDEEALVRLEEQPGRLYRQNSGLFHLAILLPTRAHLGQWLRHYIQKTNQMIGGAGDHLVSEGF